MPRVKFSLQIFIAVQHFKTSLNLSPVHLRAPLSGLYLNAVLKNEISSQQNTKPIQRAPLNIGLDSYYHTNAWKGTVDEVHFFNRVISESELSDIMNRSGQGLAGLVGYWPFDDSTADLSGSGDDGKLLARIKILEN